MANDGLQHTPTDLEKQGGLALPPAEELLGRFSVQPHPNPTSEAEWKQVMSELKFGTRFSDHMAVATWTPESEWHKREVRAYGPIELSPAAAVLHYGQEIFEGLKAYRHEDGSVWTFRPAFNAARFNASARRMGLPELSVEDFVGSIVSVVTEDERFVPRDPGTSLYLRPFMFASEPFLGVRPAREITYMMIASPVGPYFANGLAPVSIWVTRKYHRAGPGGTGAAKTGGNYASSLLPQEVAAERGFDQVCFLDAATNSNLEELGGMNVFVVRSDGTVQTPRLTGTILEGGTRSAIIRMLRDQGTRVTEETIAIDTLIADIQSGQVVELFACGTAAVVTPIGHLASDDFDVKLPQTTFTETVYDRLVSIQNGLAPDRYGWTYRII